MRDAGYVSTTMGAWCGIHPAEIYECSVINFYATFSRMVRPICSWSGQDQRQIYDSIGGRYDNYPIFTLPYSSERCCIASEPPELDLQRVPAERRRYREPCDRKFCSG